MGALEARVTEARAVDVVTLGAVLTVAPLAALGPVGANGALVLAPERGGTEAGDSSECQITRHRSKRADFTSDYESGADVVFLNETEAHLFCYFNVQKLNNQRIT